MRGVGLVDDASAIVITPNGGLHYYFSGTEQACGRLPRHHLDFRSTGGYVLTPPSQIDGQQYRLATRHSPTTELSWQVVTDLLAPGRRDRPKPRQWHRPFRRIGW